MKKLNLFQTITPFLRCSHSKAIYNPEYTSIYTHNKRWEG